MSKVSPREEMAIRLTMGVLASVGVTKTIHDEESAWQALELAAKMISYGMRKKMTAKSLRNKIAAMAESDPELAQTIREAHDARDATRH